jgi:group I intron endonuclease
MIMNYIIYKTTNNINGKFYIGKHETKNLSDDYLGSGKLLKLAIQKYGRSNFTREILFVCETEDEMNSKEKELVNESFCLREDTYNLNVGGEGSFNHINSNNLSPFGKPEFIEKHKSDILRGSQNGNKKRSKMIQEGLIDPKTFLGKFHSEETKNKMSLAKKGKCSGINNPQYGKIFITNGKENTTIPKDSKIPQGWYKGKTFKKSES